jgi:protein O-GlcNAc transferase
MNGLVPIQEAFGAAVRQHQSGQLREAESLYRQIIAAQPSHADALHMLGIALHQLGRGAESVQMLRQAIAINPKAPDYHANLGSVLAALRQPEAAVSEFRLALALKPDLAEVHNSLGKLLSAQGALDDAIGEFRQAVSQKLEFAEAHGNLADALKETGRLDDALAAYRRAVTVSPEVRWAGNLIHALYLHPDSTPRRLYESLQRWNQSHAEPLATQIPVHRNDPTPDRRLRIGYVGAHFREHPQSSFILPLLTGHDRTSFEVFCYSSSSEPDAVTERMRKGVDGWRDIAPTTDQQAAELVARDQIDVLVDLDMHTPRNRLLLFARKPAPVQATGLAYPGTTGMLAMDYRFTDSYLDPGSATEEFYSEQSIRLPGGIFCYQPPDQDTPEGELPALRNGFVTFGYLGEFPHVTSRTLELWASVLSKVDRSRLVIPVPVGGARQRLLHLLGHLGIQEVRIGFVDPKPWPGNLSAHRRIDISLDAFPWNGATSTLDALWMGVPVITLAAQTGVSRIGASLLTNLELADWIARAPEEFTRIAIRLACDLQALANLRSTLRHRLQASSLMDAAGFARNLELAYRRMWKSWCESQNHRGLVDASSVGGK